VGIGGLKAGILGKAAFTLQPSLVLKYQSHPPLPLAAVFTRFKFKSRRGRRVKREIFKNGEGKPLSESSAYR